MKHDCPNMRYCLIETQLLELAQMLFSIITFNLML